MHTTAGPNRGEIRKKAVFYKMQLPALETLIGNLGGVYTYSSVQSSVNNAVLYNAALFGRECIVYTLIILMK